MGLMRMTRMMMMGYDDTLVFDMFIPPQLMT
jgi:hypothetical protein